MASSLNLVLKAEIYICAGFPAFYTAVPIVRYTTRPCIRRLSRFGSGKAGIAAMAQAISQQRSGCSAIARTMPCGNEHTDIEFERWLKKISLTPMRNKFVKGCNLRVNAAMKVEL